MAQLSHNLRRIVQPSHNLGRIVQLSHNLGRIVQLTCHPEKDRFQHILKKRWCNLPMIPKRRCCFSSPLLTYFERILHCSYSHEKGTVEFKSPRHTLANYCHQIMTLSKKIYILFSLYTTSMEVVSNSSNKNSFLFFHTPSKSIMQITQVKQSHDGETKPYINIYIYIPQTCEIEKKKKRKKGIKENISSKWPKVLA